MDTVRTHYRHEENMILKKKITKNKDSTRYFSSKHEQSVSNELGFETISNSGATQWAKGDVKGKNYLVECKTSMTPKESVSIKKEWITKLKTESISMRKPYSVLAFNFGPDEQNYYIISSEMMKEFISMKDQLTKEIE